MKIATIILLTTLETILSSPTKITEKIRGNQSTEYQNPFIIGGEIVQGRLYPGQVSLQRFKNHKCGGSIINKNYILTAAHCSHYDAEELSIWSGSNKLSKGGTRHQVTEVIIHEKYFPGASWHNDIALMRVEQPFEFDEATSPVTLPVKGLETAAGKSATVIGWGTTNPAGGAVPDDLRKVDILISDHEQCNKTYNGDGFKIFEEQICAGVPEGNKGSCYGDSGGPLFVNGQVIGLVSWGRKCAEKGFPAVFTEVSDYIDWIESKINA